ncbi:hypothetical protein CRG98_007111 [Punica granatum]|uniref:Uncharacterized protein n=1 Tax=Punica granatum TaxID=22663 RepID=A0A2I0KVL4_PUNGR|nr:hypothetical protein CRG98_007111 [Punica granatum]
MLTSIGAPQWVGGKWHQACNGRGCCCCWLRLDATRRAAGRGRSRLDARLIAAERDWAIGWTRLDATGPAACRGWTRLGVRLDMVVLTQ